MSRSLKFANEISSRLRSSYIKDHNSNFHVYGEMELLATYALLEVRVPKRFKMVKQLPLTVICSEDWMKYGAEWHNHIDYGMCWVLNKLWNEIMSWKGKPNHLIISEGVRWFERDVKVMLERHYYATLKKLDRWPIHWVYWDHYDLGLVEYKHYKKKLEDSKS